MVLRCNAQNSPPQKMLSGKFLWNWARAFLNSINVFSLFRIYLPLERGMALHLNKPEYPSPKNALCQVWLKLALLFLRRRFLNFVNVFSLFCNHPSLERGMALHLNKIEFTLSKDALYQVWLKLAQWFWRRRFWNFILNIFLLFCYYLPLEKGMVLHLKKLESTSPKDALCQLPSLFEIGLLVLKEKKNMWKVYDKTMTTDNGQIVIRKAHLNLWLRWANKTGNKFSPITGYTT